MGESESLQRADTMKESTEREVSLRIIPSKHGISWQFSAAVTLARSDRQKSFLASTKSSNAAAMLQMNWITEQ
jgi:hypothetical protein